MSELTKYPKPPSISLSEVEWRIDSDAFKRGRDYTARWVPHLTYAKCAALMDEWVGPNNWRIDGYKIVEWGGKQGLSCQVSVRFGDGEWIARQSAGDMSGGVHAVKGSETDAFKRTVGRAWGCGRNVYELPTLWAPCRTKEGLMGKNGNLKALGETRDTQQELMSQLEQLGHASPHVRISMETEGPDPYGEGPAGVQVPVPEAEEPQEAVSEPQSAPAASGNTETGLPTATGEPHPQEGSLAEVDTGGKTLPEMLGSLQAQGPVMKELKAAGLMPFRADHGTDDWNRAAAILVAAAEAEKAASG